MTARNLSCVKEYRNALVSAIVAANIEDIGANVYNSRVEKIWPEEEAAVIVTIPNITFSDGRTSPRFYKATADVNVDLIARGFSHPGPPHRSTETADAMADWLDEKCRALIELIDPCYNSAGPFNGKVKRCVLKSVANNLSEKTETERGAARIVFTIEFALSVQNNGPLDEFLTAKNTASIGEGSGNQVSFNTNLRPST